MSSIQSVQFVIAGLPLTFHWADNFLFDLDWGNADQHLIFDIGRVDVISYETASVVEG